MSLGLKEQVEYLKALTVLYVEDDLNTREEVEFFLESRVNKLYSAANGEEGLNLFKEKKDEIDVIISDVQMPIMNGIEMCKNIRKIEANIPIVLITAFNDTDYLFKAIEIQVSKYLVKPLDLIDLTKNLSDIAKNVVLEKKNKEYENIIKQYKDIVDEYTLVSKVDNEGKFTYINKAFEKVSGYTKEEIIGKNYDLFYENDKTQCESLKEAVEAKKIWKGVLKNKFKSDKVYIFDALVKPLLDINGDVSEFITLRNDITDLENSKNKFYELSNNATQDLHEAIHLVSEYEKAITHGNIIIRYDLNKRIKFVSDSFFEQTGYTKEEIIGKDYSVLTHRDEELRQFNDRWKALEENKTYKDKVTQKTKDGNILHFNVISIPIKNSDGENIEYMSIRQNITELLNLHKELENTQKDIIYKLGEVVESRSQETGNHVKRVAEYSKLLAIKYGLSKENCDIVHMASPMHDIGKVGIEDAILNKPGKFNAQERAIMETHAQIGYDMLNNSDRPMLKSSAIIAYTHHEKWDGTGYPRGLKGEEIHIYGRIVGLADVFDALGSKRVYKKAWAQEEILEFFKKQKGKHFEPKLVDVLLENIDEFLEIKSRFKDNF